MLQKFKVTTCAFILCMFGLTLMTVSPVFADVSTTLDACKAMKWSDGKKAKKNCFRDGWSALLDSQTTPQAPQNSPVAAPPVVRGPNGSYLRGKTLLCEDITELVAIMDAVDKELGTSYPDEGGIKSDQYKYKRLVRIRLVDYMVLDKIDSIVDALCP